MVEEFSERAGDEKMRSMVDLWPELGLILVPKSFGVMRETSGLSIRVVAMAFPAKFSGAFDSHRLWCAVKSPARIKGGELLTKLVNSSA
jgi:hypothetical protein